MAKKEESFFNIVKQQKLNDELLEVIFLDYNMKKLEAFYFPFTFLFSLPVPPSSPPLPPLPHPPKGENKPSEKDTSFYFVLKPLESAIREKQQWFGTRQLENLFIMLLVTTILSEYVIS